MQNSNSNAPISGQATIEATALLPAAFRNGNLTYYHSSEDGLLPAALDWQHFKWMDENPKSFWELNSPIPICDKIISSIQGIAFKECGDHGIYTLFVDEWGMYEFTNDSNGFWVFSINSTISRNIKWLHELQNHYNAITGYELIIDLKLLEMVANEKEVVCPPTNKDELPF